MRYCQPPKPELRHGGQVVMRNSMLLHSQQPSIALVTACSSERSSPVLRWKQHAVANATLGCSEADCMLMRTPFGAAANARQRHAARSASTNGLPAEWPNALKYIVKIRRSDSRWRRGPQLSARWSQVGHPTRPGMSGEHGVAVLTGQLRTMWPPGAGCGACQESEES